MKVLVWADVHFNLWQRANTDPFGKVAEEIASVDALIVAGEIAESPAQGWPGFFGYLEGLIDLGRVWVIPGNHDYYGRRLDDDSGLAGIAAQAGVNFAQKRRFEIGGNRFLCCTLWMDFALTDDVPEAMMSARLTLPDYGRITFGPEHRPLKPADLLDVHLDHLAWLEGSVPAVGVGGRARSPGVAQRAAGRDAGGHRR
ncbi:metallophosphoesterase family protein, partial [Paracoccus sp. Z118]|uniref:metallophosphoesterase n=1 Tax=Paracoccus sp. Z118 TaxID=2851017 RepID=UPI001C2C420F